MLLKRRSDEQIASLPTAPDVLLVVEVGDTSLSFDLRAKVPLYARCDIPEVWVIDLDELNARSFDRGTAGLAHPRPNYPQAGGPELPTAYGSGFCPVARQPSTMPSIHFHAASISSRRTKSAELPSSTSSSRRS